MLAKFIAQIDLVLNSKQKTCLNKACYLVTRLVKFYPRDKRPTMVARRATLSESEAFRNEALLPRRKRRRSVAIYWGLKIGPKLLSSLVSFFTVSRLLVTGDTPKVTAVCGFRHADGISPDA